MSGEAILAAIRQESDREVEAILADARARATEVVSAARATAASRVREAVAASEPMLRAEAARRVNAARLRLLHARAEQRARRVELAFVEAERRLGGLARHDPARWAAAMERLADLACGQAGPGARLQRAGAGAQLNAESADGHVRVDATLATRLGRARRLLVDEVAEALAAAGATERAAR